MMSGTIWATKASGTSDCSGAGWASKARPAVPVTSASADGKSGEAESCSRTTRGFQHLTAGARMQSEEIPMTTTNWKTCSKQVAAAFGLALAAGPLWAQHSQDSASTQAAGSEAAKSQAEKVGMRNVEDVKGSSVLKGTSPADTVLYMIVGPAGELLALATPLPGSSGHPAASDAQGSSTGEGSNSGSQAASNSASKAGEAAESGYMATQAQPAMPNMWDPAAVENGIRQLELGTRAAAGEIQEN